LQQLSQLSGNNQSQSAAITTTTPPPVAASSVGGDFLSAMLQSLSQVGAENYMSGNVINAQA